MKYTLKKKLMAKIITDPAILIQAISDILYRLHLL